MEFIFVDVLEKGKGYNTGYKSLYFWKEMKQLQNIK